ncbi:MAG: hypothetical protein Q4B03_02145 [Lachnospiraceae bacterium]|nr:hypothetical protein [Lachnospiraceae bacterium]
MEYKIFTIEELKTVYQTSLPELLSERSGVFYDRSAREFRVMLQAHRYRVTHPDFQISCEDEEDLLTSYNSAQIYLLQTLLFLLPDQKKAVNLSEDGYTILDLRQVQEGIYPLNGGGAQDICLTTVDFALTYLIVAKELEDCGLPCNLIICECGGLAVATGWCSGKYNPKRIADSFSRNRISELLRCRKLIIPGRAEDMVTELGQLLKNWEIQAAPVDASGLGSFLSQFRKASA